MQNAEIELKFPVSDPEALQALLPGLGFHLETPRTFEHNTLYDTPTRGLRARTQLLRLRQYGNICTLTHKRLPDNPLTGTRYKTRIETETTIANCDAMAEIFKQLGYLPAFTYEKYRSEWSHRINPDSTAHLVLDETPIGVYAELEGPPDWIDQTLASLHIDHAICLTDSYGKLFLDWKQRTGHPAENLTFAEISDPRPGKLLKTFAASKKACSRAGFFLTSRSKSINLEVNFHIHLHGHRLAILHRRLELVLPHRFHGLLVQSHANATNHMHMTGKSILIHPKVDHNIPRELGLASLLREVRIHLVDQYWSRNSSTDAPRTATRIAARPRPKP